MYDKKEHNRNLRSLVRRRNHFTLGLSRTVTFVFDKKTLQEPEKLYIITLYGICTGKICTAAYADRLQKGIYDETFNNNSSKL